MGDCYMINDFLKKYQEELISEKIQLKEDMDLLETKIKEETKFLDILEQSNDSVFKELSPRDINAKNNEKAAEVRLIIEDLNSQMSSKNNQMKFYDGRLVEVNALINNTAVLNKPVIEKVEEKKEEDKTLTEDSNVQETNINKDNSCDIVRSELIAQLSNIKSLILLDPYRAQIELDNIISNI